MNSILSSLVDNDVILPPVGYSNNDGLEANQYTNHEIDSEIKRLLIDEKERNDQLKKYYETLKADYSRSQSEVLELQTQLRSLIEENKVMQDKYKSMFEKMQQELRKKQLYIEDLKNKELDEVKLEKLKEELSQEIEMPYKDIVKQFELELEKLQQECNRVRYENSFLKSTNEHDKNEFQTLAEQLKLKHDIELSAMRKDRDLIRTKLQEFNHIEANKLKEVIKENNGFKIKLKSLIEENEELREKIEHNDAHQNSLIRNHTKAVSDLTAKISLLESEKESLKHQNENSYKETLNLNETIANNIRKIHDLERENSTLKLHVEEVQYNSKKEIANLKLEFSKERGDLSRNRESLLNKIEEMKTQCELADSNVKTCKRQLEEKEREITKNVNSANEENWIKINELTNEKLDLESKLQILQKDLEYKTNILQGDKEKCEEKLRALEKQRDEVYRDNNRLRALISDIENVRGELEREQEKNRELYKKCHKLETELAANNGLEQELTEINLKLKNELSFYTQEIQKSKEHLQRMKDEYENRLMDMKTQYISEKSEYQLKHDEIQSKLTKTNSKMSEIQNQNEARKRQYQNFMKKIKTKTELLNAKIRELKIKEQALKDYVPLDVHNNVKKQLQDILKKHQDFRNMLTFNNQNSNSNMTIMNSQPHIHQVNQPPLNLLPVYVPKSNDVKILPDSNKDLFPTKFEFDEIRNRLDMLTQKQNEHLKEIVGKKHKKNLSARSHSSLSSRSVSPNLNTLTRPKTSVTHEGPQSKSPISNVRSNSKSPALNHSRIKYKEPSSSSSHSSDNDQSSTEEEVTPKSKNNKEELLSNNSWNNKKSTIDHSGTTDIKTASRLEKSSRDSSTNSTINNSNKAVIKKSDENDENSYEDDFNTSKSSSK